MSQFKDANGRSWSIDINVNAIKRVKRLLPEVDLLEISSGETPLVVRLLVDVVLLCDVLYCLCEPEATKQGITDEKFGESMGGDALLNGQNALMDELSSFFQSLHRTELVEVIRQGRAMVRATIQAADARISGVDMAAMAELTVGKLFTAARESAELTLDHSLSGS